MKMSKCFRTLAAAIGLQVTAVKGANLVTNADFTSDVTGWSTTCPGTLSWDGSDGDPAPGSAHSQGGYCPTSSCIVLAAPQSIDLYANIKVSAGAARAQVNGFLDTACTTGITFGIAVTPITSNSIGRLYL